MALRGEVALLSYILILGVTGLTVASLQFTDSLVDSTVPITGYVTSPNSAPILSSISASTYSVRAGDYLTIYSTASDTGDTIQLQCASAPDTNPAYRLCTSGYFSSNPSCTFQAPKVPAGTYSVYCAAYDGAAYSSISTISVTMLDTPLTVTCYGNPSSILPGQTVQWIASVGGGSGSYTHSWTGTDGLYSSAQTVQNIFYTYYSSGTKTATVTVTSGSETVTQSCGSVNVQAPASPPSCLVSPSSVSVNAGDKASFSVSYSNDADGRISYNCGVGGSGAFPVPASLGGNGNTPTAGSGVYSESLSLKVPGYYPCTLTVQNSAGATNTCAAAFNVFGTTCSDGTLYGSCSITKPKRCYFGTLINDATTCGCPAGQIPSGDNCINSIAAPSCLVSPSSVSVNAGDKASFSVSYSNDADGRISYNCGVGGSGAFPVPASLGGNGNTPVAGSGTYFESVQLKVLGNYPCNLTVQNSAGATNSCSVTFNVIGATCSDGTSSGACSVTKPKYCSGSVGLIDNCGLCGCPSGFTCQASGSCSALSSPAPTVDIKANNQDSLSVTSGSSVTLSWTSSGATSCTASGAWSGSKAASGSATVSPTVTTTYTISCTGSGGSTSDSVTVNVGPTCSDGTPYGSCSITKPKRCYFGTLINDATSCGCPAGQTPSGDNCINSIAVPSCSVTPANISVFAGNEATFSVSYSNDADGWIRYVCSFAGTTLAPGYLPIPTSLSGNGNTPVPGSGSYNEKIKLTSPGVYGCNLDVQNSAGEVRSCFVRFNVILVGVPQVDLKANGNDNLTISSGTNVTLSWTGSLIRSCTASGDWSGTRLNYGNENIGPIFSNKKYTITCESSSSGDVTDSVMVNVVSTPQIPTCYFNDSIILATVGKSTSAFIGYSNDADGVLPYSCGDIGSSQLYSNVGSGSIIVPINITPRTTLGTRECKVTVQNSAGLSNTCTIPLIVSGTLSVTDTRCLDGTAVGSCSPTKPKYCSGSVGLVDNCGLCGCLSGSTCQASGSCVNASTSLPFDISVDLLVDDQESTTVRSGSFVTLRWRSFNANSCIASGSTAGANMWSGSKTITGSESIGPITAKTTFALTCTGPAGSKTDEVEIEISQDNTIPRIFVSQSGSLTVGNTLSIFATAYDQAQNLDKIIIFFDDRVVKVCDAKGRGLYADCVSYLTSSELIAGIHTYSVFANDTASNTARSPLYTINVVRADNTPPVLSVTTLPEVPVPGKFLLLVGTVSEESLIKTFVAKPGDSDYRLVNECLWTTCGFGINLIDADVGLWKYRFEARDLAGNTVSKTGTVQVYPAGTTEAPLARETINSVIQYLESVKSRGTQAASDVNKIAQYYRSTGDIETAEKYEAVLELINNGIVKIDDLRSKILANVDDPEYLKTLKPEFDAIKELATAIAENLKFIRNNQ